VGSIDRGAPLSFLSQYPAEDEILIPPMSFTEITGEPYTMDVDNAQVTVYPARINCNLKGQTMEQIEERRRADLLAQEPYLKEEFLRDVGPVLEVLKTHASGRWVGGLSDIDVASEERKYCRLWEQLKTNEAVWFNNDAHYLRTIHQAFNFKHNLISNAVRALFQVSPTSHRPALFVAVEQEACDVLKALVSMQGAEIDATDEVGTTAAQFAAERGSIDALKVLNSAGADLCAARHDGVTALGRAVLSSPTSKDSTGAIRFILERTNPSLDVKDGMEFHTILNLLARAFMSPAALAERLAKVSPTGLKGEIGALLRSTDLSDAVKAGLSKVRAFLDRHDSLLASADPGLPHRDTRVWQLASQEPDDVFGAHADMVVAASNVPRLIQWLNKPQTPHPCRFTIKAESMVMSAAYSKCGTRIVRAEGAVVVVSDAETFFELHRFTEHTAHVRCVAFNPTNPDELVSCSDDKTIKLFSMKTRSCTGTMTGHRCHGCLCLCPLLLCVGVFFGGCLLVSVPML
jgi:hypothetical protein